MANHQHALVRYVTLDRCLSRHRLTKEELIARCSAAVSDVTGDHRQLSERTFFNDLQALRDGIILGRCASILCTQGRYAYEEQGRSLFTAGDAEVERMARRLAAMEGRVQEALDLLQYRNAPPEVLAEMRNLLLGDGLFGWVAGRQRAEDGAVKERFRGMMNPSDKLTTEPAFKRRQPMERREIMERKEGDELPPDITPASQEDTPQEGDAAKPIIRSKESKIVSSPTHKEPAVKPDGPVAPRPRPSDISEMRSYDAPPPRIQASRKPPRISREQALELALSTLQGTWSQRQPKQGWMARFLQCLRVKRLLRLVRRVVK
jgi:hypothetical protein